MLTRICAPRRGGRAAWNVCPPAARTFRRLQACAAPGVLAFWLVLALNRASAQPVMPDAIALPRLSIEGLPTPVRTAVQDAYAAAAARPRDAAARGHLCMVLHAYEQYGLAGTCYRGARELDPRSLSWTYLSAVVEAELGENGTAAALFRRALEIEPGYWPARLRLADALTNAGDLEGGAQTYEAVIHDFPDLAVAHYGFGRLLSTRGDAAKATLEYERAVELEPGFGAAHYALALAYRNAGVGERAREEMDLYRELGPRRPAPPDRLLDQIKPMKAAGRDLLAEGVRLGAKGRLSDAIALHLKAIEADPSDAQAHVNLISLYGRTGQPDRAAAHYASAVALGGSLAEAHYNYGVLMAGVGRYDDAAEAFRQALAADPFYAQAHQNLAALLARQGKLDDAAVHYRQALANDPQHRGARFGLGRVLLALGRPREAIDQFLKILRPEDGDTPRYLFALATAWAAAGESAEGRRYAERALGSARAMRQTALAGTIEQWLRQIEDVPR